MDDDMNIQTHQGICFASSRTWASSTIDAFVALAKNSSAGLQAVRQAEDGGYTAFWATGPLCSQSPTELHGAPVWHELNGPPPVVDYFKYIGTPGSPWVKRTRSRKKYQGFKCADCGRPCNELQGAHRDYNRLGAEIVLYDVEAICDACHRKRHGIV